MQRNEMNENDQNIDEAGGWIDRKILSKVGTKRSKKTAETKVIDKKRAGQLWDAYLEVTGGGKEFDVRELVSWLEKEVTIDGVKITKDIIKSALNEAPFKVSVGDPEKKEEPAAPQKQKAAEPKKEPAKDTAQAPTSTTPSLKLPDTTAQDGDWQNWADELAKTQPHVFTKIAKAMGAKIQARKRA